jgi:cytoskeletal protein RodZ
MNNRQSMSKKERSSKRNRNKTGEPALSSAGIGELLKRERENRGLSHEQVSEMTKLRVHILRALEEEDWKELPQPVFVRGFIRSYARILGIDEGEALSGYEDHASVEQTPPRPLMVHKGPGKGWILYLTLLFCGLGLLFLYLWMGSPLTEERRVTPEWRKMPKPQERERQPPTGTAAVTEERPIEVEEAPDRRAEEEREEAPSRGEPESIAATDRNTEDISEALVLNGQVKMRTWMRVQIDGQEPKEYIFQPGARPRWTAKKGFDLMVGNAAGIDFELDGEEYKNLGGLGEVVRLRLPEGAGMGE